MKRCIRLASYFYPAGWRKRYAMEFDALLDEMDTGWKDVFDILKGAPTVHFTSWNFKSIALTFAVIGAVIAAAAAFSIPNQYRSVCVMRISPQNPVNGGWQAEAAQHLDEMQQEVLSRTSLAGVITGLGLYEKQRNEKPLEDIVQNMRNHDISIKPIRAVGERQDGGTAFTISYVYPDPKLAQAVTRELVTKFTEQNVSVQRGSGIRNGENLLVLDPPSGPVQPIYPKRAEFIFLGLVGGLLAGLAVACALRWPISHYPATKTPGPNPPELPR